MSLPRRQWDELDDFVLRRLHELGRDADWIARFMCCNSSTIYRRARWAGLAFNVHRHIWSREDDALLRKRFPNERTADIARDLGLRTLQVSQHAARLGLHKSAEYLASPSACRLRRGDNVGKQYRFPKGHVPFNKGLRRPGWYRGRMRETQFKKGRPASETHNYCPIGTEKVDPKRGVLMRKMTDDPSIFPAYRWRPVHVLVWESVHGPVPAGYIVRFKTGLKSLVAGEITIDKLELVTLAENMRRNSIHNLPKPLKDVVQLRGRLMRQIHKREKKA